MWDRAFSHPAKKRAPQPRECLTRNIYARRKRIGGGGNEGAQRRFHGAFEVNAHAAAAPFVERHPIAERLRGEQRAKADLHSGNHRVVGIVRRDLQDDARIGAAFVELPGRMEEARAEADGRRDAARVADLQTKFLEKFDVRRIARDVGGDGVVIVRPQLREELRQRLRRVLRGNVALLPER